MPVRLSEIHVEPVSLTNNGRYKAQCYLRSQTHTGLRVHMLNTFHVCVSCGNGSGLAAFRKLVHEKRDAASLCSRRYRNQTLYTHAQNLVRISYPFQPPPSKFNFTLIRDTYGFGADSERSFENYFANLKRIVIVNIKVIE